MRSTKEWQMVVSQLLNHIYRNAVIYGFVMCALGLAIAFGGDNSLLPGILLVAGMELAILPLVWRYLTKKSSVKVLVYAIFLFSTLNFLRHNLFFVIVSRIRELYEYDFWFNWFLITESIWFIVSLWILSRGLNLLFPKEEISYEEYVASKEFRVLTILILCLFVLEIPVFGLHGDLGGYVHGHSFWEGWSHLH